MHCLGDQGGVTGCWICTSMRRNRTHTVSLYVGLFIHFIQNESRWWCWWCTDTYSWETSGSGRVIVSHLLSRCASTRHSLLLVVVGVVDAEECVSSSLRQAGLLLDASISSGRIWVVLSITVSTGSQIEFVIIAVVVANWFHRFYCFPI